MSKQEIVERLKAVQDEEAEADYAEGKAAGRAWAESSATPKELRRIADYCASTDNRDICWWDVDGRWSAKGGATDSFFAAARPSRFGEHGASEEFWTEAVEGAVDRINDSDFLHGFGDGVCEVWEEVSDEL